MPRVAMDLSGQRFGRLTAIELVSVDGVGRRKWRCRCECGGECFAEGSALRRGNNKSCGCLQLEANRVHGHTHYRGAVSGEYRSWQAMKDRCGNPNAPNYGRYGGRGIAVCDRWRDSFAIFLADLGPRPTAKHTLDRIDNDGDYEPGNCRWVTRGEQAKNRSWNPASGWTGPREGGRFAAKR